VVWNCKNNEVATDGAIYKIIDGIRYTLKDGIATVIEQTSNIAGSITIPTSVMYNGSTYAVTSIGYRAFYNCSSLTEIVIPESVTSIGERAFYSCSSLTTVTFGDNSQLTSIGAWAFAYCSSLTEIVIPEGVTSIGFSAFYGCDSLTIYCEAESKPSGWSRNWNDSSCPVVWGYTGE